MAILSPIINFSISVSIFAWDGLLVLGNLLTPNLAWDRIVPEGHPGFEGKWPEFIAPKEGYSRCSCPGLNAMANHGIIARDGRNISFAELNHKIRATYNFAPTFCFFLPNYAAGFMGKSYSHGTFDLEELDKHNEIEHDASLVREDVYCTPDQSTIPVPLIESLLSSATGPLTKDPNDPSAPGTRTLTAADLARAMSQRLADCEAENPEFTTGVLHRLFGAGNSSMLLSIFGGSIPDLRALLLEERFLDGWVPFTASRYGVTLAAFNVTAMKVWIRMRKVAPAKKVV